MQYLDKPQTYDSFNLKLEQKPGHFHMKIGYFSIWMKLDSNTTVIAYNELQVDCKSGYLSNFATKKLFQTIRYKLVTKNIDFLMRAITQTID